MKISQSNQFVDAKIIQINTEEQIIVRKKIDWKPQPTDQKHTVSMDETIDQIAYRYYKNKRANAEAYWWVIADANNIFNPLDLSDLIGSQLVIPDILLLDFQR